MQTQRTSNIQYSLDIGTIIENVLGKNALFEVNFCVRGVDELYE